MTSLELQERKNWALDILQACNSEEAISYMESLARKLIKIEKAELKRPNCFTLEEVKEMLKETNRDKENGKRQRRLSHIIDFWRSDYEPIYSQEDPQQLF